MDDVIARLDDTNLPPGVANLRLYRELKDRGLSVVSGAIENGNKKVIQQQMK